MIPPNLEDTPLFKHYAKATEYDRDKSEEYGKVYGSHVNRHPHSECKGIEYAY